MRYKDKATIKQVTNHQNKPESIYYGQNMTNRQKQRMRERLLKDFRLKVTDKIWWDSLNDNDKTEVAYEYRQFKEGNNLKELMILYPGNKSYIRDAKLNELGI
jgi:aryl-phospho-beta-D-glucosidase BglC (GH1 family)